MLDEHTCEHGTLADIIGGNAYSWSNEQRRLPSKAPDDLWWVSFAKVSCRRKKKCGLWSRSPNWHMKEKIAQRRAMRQRWVIFLGKSSCFFSILDLAKRRVSQDEDTDERSAHSSCQDFSRLWLRTKHRNCSPLADNSEHLQARTHTFTHRSTQKEKMKQMRLLDFVSKASLPEDGWRRHRQP